ncbi:MAG: hypothetical protein WD733_08215 [Bryobacterales bacterium]
MAALPLGSRLAIDPWTNQVRMLEGKPMAPKEAAEEAHFGLSPMMAHLTRATEATGDEIQPQPKALTAAE